MLLEPVAAVGGKAHPEPRLALRRYAPLQQIAARPRPDIMRQRRLEILRGQLHHVGQRALRRFPTFLLFVPRRHRHAGHARQLFHGFGKAQSHLVGQELEVIARYSTPEAVIKAPPVVGMEAGALFAMKRAAGPHVALARLALALVPHDVLAHHLRNRQALADFFEELVSETHAH